MKYANLFMHDYSLIQALLVEKSMYRQAYMMLDAQMRALCHHQSRKKRRDIPSFCQPVVLCAICMGKGLHVHVVSK